jgi:hypothetical protein
VARIKLGDLMIKAGLIDEMQLQSALALQRQWGGKLGDVLVNNGFIDEMMLWKGLSHQLGVPLVSLPDEKIAPGIQKVLPLDTCLKHSIFPLTRDEKSVTIATSDPNNLGGIDEITFRIGARLKLVLAPGREIEWAIRHHYQGDPSPCPAPKTKRVPSRSIPEQMTPSRDEPATMTPAPGPALGQPAQTSAAELAALAARVAGAAASHAAAAAPPAKPWWAQPKASDAELAIRETAHLLRFLVEACVQRGVFTRDEYLAKLKSLG